MDYLESTTRSPGLISWDMSYIYSEHETEATRAISAIHS
jgi:hypothetical protein